MKMMYKIVAKEIKSSGLDNAHPTDYLNFYCLGNREDRCQTSSDGLSKPRNLSMRLFSFFLFLNRPPFIGVWLRH
ncbi:hypothetical protein CASFOL_021983 [Castilleja foliolosa]|uniref:Uncharacterized protein n=1 Tax=Castilleja foliolosa TaxID=1961234 RepID=A0ABD3D0U1_9LAMI